MLAVLMCSKAQTDVLSRQCYRSVVLTGCILEITVKFVKRLGARVSPDQLNQNFSGQKPGSNGFLNHSSIDSIMQPAL